MLDISSVSSVFNSSKSFLVFKPPSNKKSVQRSVLYILCLSGFCWVLFLNQDEYGVGLNVELPNKPTS